MVRCALSLLACLVVVARADWPPRDEDLVFLFERGTEELFALDPASGEKLLNYSLKPSGWARYTGQGLMELAHGSYRAPGQEQLVHRLAAQASLELWLWPDTAQNGVIFSLGGALTLEQRGEQLHCQLTTAQGSVNLSCPLPVGQGSAIALGLATDRLSLYRNGQEVATEPLAAPVRWRELGPSFGSGDFEHPGWSGRLGYLGLYRGAFDAVRAAEHFRALSALLEPPPEPLIVDAVLRACSKVATPAAIEPYPDSLAVFEYEVKTLVSGMTWDKTIRVAHYVVLDHRALPAAAAAPGEVHRLVLQPFAANRQVGLIHRTETLPPDPKLRLYLATQILTR